MPAKVLGNKKSDRVLFVSHHAGGFHAFYMPIFKELFETHKLVFLDLPSRTTADWAQEIPELKVVCEKLCLLIDENWGEKNYFFGHSMGAMILWECLSRHYSDKVSQFELIVSGMRSPHHNHRRIDFSLEDVDFLRALGFNDEKAIASKAWQKEFVPLLRNDLKWFVAQDFNRDKIEGLKLHVFGGESDPLTSIKGLRDWQRLTSRSVDLRLFSGDHFYFLPQVPLFLDRIKHIIL